MEKILLSDLIIKAKKAITPLGHSKSTVYQYGLAWDELALLFNQHNQETFSEALAYQFVEQTTNDFKKGKLKAWRFKLYRLATNILLEVYQTGGYKWKQHCADPNIHLSTAHKKFHEAFQGYLIQTGKSHKTRELYGTVTRQFLTWVQNERNITVATLELKKHTCSNCSDWQILSKNKYAHHVICIKKLSFFSVVEQSNNNQFSRCCAEQWCA